MKYFPLPRITVCDVRDLSDRTATNLSIFLKVLRQNNNTKLYSELHREAVLDEPKVYRSASSN